ncbi:Ig-like domain-containing protein [Hyalangium sp.]|uniref:Ig-like domain-containing protein n=1 Tax=Hyalangium sp. TaxID=2028555 RepID=UPI002D5974E9|nr:PKD domain-containing protein [Hyalangium sp.]HYH97487.1 PKD domain-containing protein [Hyalangium sp.]
MARVTLTVSAPDISPSIVSNLQNTGGQWRGVIGAIPVGGNRTFLAQAFNAANTQIYEGQATGVTISSGAPAVVVILLQQSTPSTPFVNSAPKITGLTASVSQVDVNQPVTLSLTATDADGDPLSYAWTATGGTFANGATASPTWTSPATEGTYTLNVSMSDGRGGQAGISLRIAVVHARATAKVAVSFNAWPVATQVTGTPSGQVAAGEVVNLDVAAVDPDNDPLTYSWADDCGGSFSGLTLRSPTWTAPAAAPASEVCTVTVTLNDGRGGSTTGQLGINVGLPQVPTLPPVIDQTFQSVDTIAVSGTVELSVSAHDPEGTALTFTWSASAGTLGTPVTSASQSNVIWTAPSQGTSSTVTLVVQDASGQSTTQSFTISLTGGAVSQTCVMVVTSYLNEVNPYGSPLTVVYSMVGGAGGGGGTTGTPGSSGATATGSFTLGAGNLEVFVGGGGGFSHWGSGGTGGGGAGYYGGGGSGTTQTGLGGGGGGGSSAILSAGQLIHVAAGGSGFWGAGGGSTTGGTAGNDPTGTATPTAGTAGAGGGTATTGGGTGLNGGTGSTVAGGGGGYGGGGGGNSGATSGGTAGGTGGGSGGGLGANTWSTATTLPAGAGAGSPVGGNAGLVILTYSAPTCLL